MREKKVNSQTKFLLFEKCVCHALHPQPHIHKNICESGYKTEKSDAAAPILHE